VNKQINILFLGGAKRVSLAEHFKSSALRRNVDLSIFSYELTELVPISSVAKVIVGLRWSDNMLISHLCEIIKANNIQMVLPFVDPAIEISSQLKHIFNDLYIPCCPANICQIMFNKKLSAKWFSENEIPVPETFSDVFSEFPLILKPITGSASRGIKVVHNKVELSEVKNLNEYLIQRYIENREEYTVDCFISNSSELISIVPRIRLDTAGGEVVNSLTVRNNSIIEISKKILGSEKFIGPVTIQFLKDLSNDKVYVMEINPRLGGGVVASICAGADILGVMIDEFLGLPIFPINDWRENTLMTRYFKEVIFYANHN
jgi:carbamoyl-phosphate synthase large subunit